ncbi:MAG: hypothetical protein LZF61_05355 [Nitrosomonas sp.]|nr:MAG: hypothetical protein LZF61_05355 [Nitrosomonas sp.]
METIIIVAKILPNFDLFMMSPSSFEFARLAQRYIPQFLGYAANESLGWYYHLSYSKKTMRHIVAAIGEAPADPESEKERADR